MGVTNRKLQWCRSHCDKTRQSFATLDTINTACNDLTRSLQVLNIIWHRSNIVTVNTITNCLQGLHATLHELHFTTYTKNFPVNLALARISNSTIISATKWLFCQLRVLTMVLVIKQDVVRRIHPIMCLYNAYINGLFATTRLLHNVQQSNLIWYTSHEW